jgi:hypothetical protein
MNDQISKNPNPNKPDNSQIEELLIKFTPHPRACFYTKMEKAPWIKSIHNKRIRFFNSNSPVRRWLLGMTIISLIFILIGISFFPSVRVVARQIIYSFISAPSNHIEIQVTLSNPGDLFHFSDPSNFPLTIQEVQVQSGYSVKELSRLTKDLQLVGSRFDTSYNAVTILYKGNEYKLFLTQRPVGNGEDIFSIGSTAQVNLVKIGDQHGEFVVGGWKAISTQTIPNTLTPGNQTDINAVWDSSLPQYTLRWQIEGSMYELRSIGEGSPSKLELISLANELK